MTHPFTIPTPDGLDLRLKVVPGASRDRVVGVLGDRLKIQVSAAPEAGKANKAVIAVLAAWIGCREADLELITGHGQPLKTVRYRGQRPLPAL